MLNKCIICGEIREPGHFCLGGIEIQLGQKMEIVPSKIDPATLAFIQLIGEVALTASREGVTTSRDLTQAIHKACTTYITASTTMVVVKEPNQ